MDELGVPISYEVLERGTAVFSADGARVGAVEHLLAAEGEDMFDGIVVDTGAGPGDGGSRMPSRWSPSTSAA